MLELSVIYGDQVVSKERIEHSQWGQSHSHLWIPRERKEIREVVEPNMKTVEVVKGHMLVKKASSINN